MNFNDYLWDLLTRPFRREGTSEIKLFFSVVGGLFDRAKQTVFLLRRQWIVLTASEDALRLLGAERGIFRTDSESLANYRRRVSAAYMIYVCRRHTSWHNQRSAADWLYFSNRRTQANMGKVHDLFMV